jgi:hypothetical protein
VAESPYAAAVQGHVAKDYGAPIASRSEADFGANRDWRRKKYLRNGFEKPNLGLWDFPATAEKAMQSRTWLRRCKLRRSDINCQSPGKSKWKFRIHSNISGCAPKEGTFRLESREPLTKERIEGIR